MSDISELGYYKLTGAGYGIGADGPDTGFKPDAYAVTCDVWLRPRLTNISTQSLSVIANSRKALLFLAPIKARLEKGILRLDRPVGDVSESTDPLGSDGVWLVAETAALNLPENSHLVVDVEFGPASINGTTFRYDSFTYRVPTEPGTSVDLSDVDRINLPPTAGANVLLRMVPDGWDLNTDGVLRFFANGVELPTANGIINLDDIVGDRLDVAVGGLNDTRDAAITAVHTARDSALTTVDAAVTAAVPGATSTYIESLEAHAEDVGGGNAKLVIGGVDGPTFAGYPAVWTGILGKPPNAINVKEAPYNAKGDGQKLDAASISAASATLTVTGAGFTSADVGKHVSVVGAGVAGAPLDTTITARTSSTQVTLAAAASTTVSGASVSWGTDDTTAIGAALAAAALPGGFDRPIYFPAGVYLTDDIVDTSNSEWIGAGSGTTWIRPKSSSTTTLVDMTNTGSGSTSKKVSGLTLDGLGYSDTCWDTSWSTYSGTTRHQFEDICIIGFTDIGWIGDNNNAAWIKRIVINNYNVTGTVGARLHAGGGEMWFHQCFFYAPLHLCAEIAVFDSCETMGIVIDNAGKNILVFHGGYLYTHSDTHINFEIAAGYRCENASFHGVLISNTFSDGFMFGGSGDLAKVNIYGGQWFGFGADVKLVSNDVGSTDDIVAVFDLDGVMLSRIDISNATRALVRSRWCTTDGVYGSTGGAVDYHGSGTVVNSILSSISDKLTTLAVTGDTGARLQIYGTGAIYWGPGNTAPDFFLQRDSLGLETNGAMYADKGFSTGGGTWNSGHLLLGSYHLWIDSSGRLRVKSSAPTSDTDGTVVGTQS